MTLLPHEESPLVSRFVLAEDIRNVLRHVTGRPFEVGRVPADIGTSDEPNVPYGIVIPTTGGAFWGPPLLDPHRYAVYEFTIMSVGLRTDQAELLAEKVREVMVGRSTAARGYLWNIVGIAYTLPQRTDPAIPGNPRQPSYHIQERELMGPPGGADREDKITTVSETYLVRVEAR